MKTLSIFLSAIFLSCICGFDSNSAKAYASSSAPTFYAKILTSGSYFYTSCSENSCIFEIPTTYFVLLTGDADEKYYSAKYGDLTGFVKKTEVVPMKGTPQAPYATEYNFRITSMSGLSLQKKATFESEKITNLAFLEDNTFFYGNMLGQEFFPNSTKNWIYAGYKTEDKTYYGYLFSYYCDFETKVKDNDEYFEEITETLSFAPPQQEVATNMSDTVKALIILAVVIPVLIGCYFFIAPPKKRNGGHTKVGRHKDYYELKESDLN